MSPSEIIGSCTYPIDVSQLMSMAGSQSSAGTVESMGVFVVVIDDDVDVVVVVVVVVAVLSGGVMVMMSGVTTEGLTVTRSVDEVCVELLVDEIVLVPAAVTV